MLGRMVKDEGSVITEKGMRGINQGIKLIGVVWCPRGHVIGVVWWKFLGW